MDGHAKIGKPYQHLGKSPNRPERDTGVVLM
jgi:hypothetical protein